MSLSINYDILNKNIIYLFIKTMRILPILLICLLITGCSSSNNSSVPDPEKASLDLVIQAKCWEDALNYIDYENEKSSNNYTVINTNYNPKAGICYAYTKIFESTALLNGDPAPSYIYTIWNVTQRENIYIIMHDIVRNEWFDMGGDLDQEKWNVLLEEYF